MRTRCTRRLFTTTTAPSRWKPTRRTVKTRCTSWLFTTTTAPSRWKLTRWTVKRRCVCALYSLLHLHHIQSLYWAGQLLIRARAPKVRGPLEIVPVITVASFAISLKDNLRMVDAVRFCLIEKQVLQRLYGRLNQCPLKDSGFSCLALPWAGDLAARPADTSHPAAVHLPLYPGFRRDVHLRLPHRQRASVSGVPPELGGVEGSHCSITRRGCPTRASLWSTTLFILLEETRTPVDFEPRPAAGGKIPSEYLPYFRWTQISLQVYNN